MAETEETPGASAGDEIKPYKIHVSSKYLELTRQKLELTRLPHEGAGPASKGWWEPKPQVEPLIDFWLERYSWRDQEAALNQTPQFRTGIAVTGAEVPLRLHFIHVPAPATQNGGGGSGSGGSGDGQAALPLLLLPPFPLSNLALVHLVKAFTEPDDAARDRAFHLVIPALPGLGFSDPLPNAAPEIEATAEVLNTLMLRLGYTKYLVSNSGPAHASPGGIDWRLIERLSSRYSESCVGAHFIAPPLASPKLSEAPIEWAKWTIANTLNAGILGYSAQDFSALKQAPSATPSPKTNGFVPSKLGLNNVGLREPNTLAYAMCDSPSGLLVFAMKGLSLLGPRMQLTPEQIITFTNLAWLPGPEYAMRFWAHCATDATPEAKETRATPRKPKVGITVFLGGKDEETGDTSTAREVGDGAIRLESPMKVETGAGYACPAWGKAHYNVLFSQRVRGNPGLLAWERPEVILTGIRGLAKEILKVDSRLLPTPANEASTAALEELVVADTTEEAKPETQGLKAPERPALEQGDSSRTQVASQPPSSPKGKEVEAASPPPLEENMGRTDSPREQTPDTVVLVTAPTDEELVKK